MTGHKHLSSELEDIVEDILRRIKPPKRYSIFQGQDPKKGLPKFEHFHRALGAHDPEYVSAIQEQFRRFIEQIYRKYPKHWWVQSDYGVEKGIYPKPVRYFGVETLLNITPEAAPIFSNHWNGYLREKAVQVWPERITSAFELAMLIARMNDWVVFVRGAVTIKLNAIMKLPSEQSGLTTDVIFECLPLILASDRFGRMDPPQKAILKGLFQRGEIENRLGAQIKADKTDRAARHLKMALRHGLLEDELEAISKDAAHYNARATAYKALLRQKIKWNGQMLEFSPPKNPVDIAARALEDPSPVIQRLGLDYVNNHQPPELHRKDVYERFIHNKRTSLVDRAAFGLNAFGVDWKGPLLDSLGSGELSKRDIVFATRYGRRADAERLMKLAEDLQAEQSVHFFGAAALMGFNPAINTLLDLAIKGQGELKEKAIVYLKQGRLQPDARSLLARIEDGEEIKGRAYMG